MPVYPFTRLVNSVPSGTFSVYRHEIYQTSNDAGTADSDTARQRSDATSGLALKNNGKATLAMQALELDDLTLLCSTLFEIRIKLQPIII